MIKKILALQFLIFTAMHSNESRYQFLGYFLKDDPTTDGIMFGNWGSRPYEYKWVSEVIPVKNKKVIDLGTGIPSQYNWYKYVVKNLKPSLYMGIDFDARIIPEQIKTKKYSMLHMNMADLKFDDKSFDVAYCISTYEHMLLETFIQSIKETHRVLKNGGFLVLTLDEEWDKNEPMTGANGWNILEQDLIEKGLFKREKHSFGLPTFLNLIKEWFAPIDNDILIDLEKNEIRSKQNPNKIYYKKINADPEMLNSGLLYNSCVSFAILKKI